MNFWKSLIGRSGKTFLLCLLAAGAPALTGCTPPEDSVEQRPLTDSELKTNIEARLNSDDVVRAANLKVEANAALNQATLSGRVTSEDLRTRAIHLAHSAHRGLIVDARIDVKAPDVARSSWTEEYARIVQKEAAEAGDVVSESLDDTWIHARIVAELVADSTTPKRTINVDVDKNVVTLRGAVETSAARAEAARIANETSGVVRVVNQLRVVRDSDRG